VQWNNVAGPNLSQQNTEQKASQSKYTRYQLIEGVKGALKGKVVVSNIGVPSKELYDALHQPSNFYMMGSLGLATSIGLGIALNTGNEVVVIDGDGSLLMNTGCLATTASESPSNLTILALDNGVHGSTGNQPTATSKVVNLEIVAKGMGIKNTTSAHTPEETRKAMQSGKGPRFIHIPAVPGNKNVQNIPLTAQEIKKGVMEFLKK